jgi:hypothetical protein
VPGVGGLQGPLDHASVGVVEGDFADVKVEGEFGLAFISRFALSALTTQDLQVQCFENVAAHLAPGGFFVVELMAPASGVLENGRAWASNVKLFVSTADHVTQEMRTARPRWSRPPASTAPVSTTSRSWRATSPRSASSTAIKRKAGLSPEEILNKKESLLGVLQPVSTDDNLALLREAGFTSYGTILKYLAFEGFIAIK